MSDLNNIISVKDLLIGIKNEEGNDYRFKINYGSFDVKPGDFILIKGHNGSGKSTFLKMFHLQGYNYFKVLNGGIIFNDELFPDNFIHNYNSKDLTRLNCAISFIGQEESFLTSDSAYSYIYNTCKYALSIYNYSASELKNKLDEVDKIIYEWYEKYLSKSFHTKNYKIFKNKNIRAWSGGQQKMINVLAGIIKAKICNIRLLVMDEPLNNLDGVNKNILNKLIHELMQNDLAIIAITHCQIFTDVNKVLLIGELNNDERQATIIERKENPHLECLENYN